MVRLAIVGIGGYGRDLVNCIRRVAEPVGCRLVAAADTRLASLPDAAEELGRTGTRLFDDPMRMFDALRGECDAVYIATGIPSHAPLAMAAAEAGFHVHLEKPPAATVQEVDEMLAAFRRTGTMCLVGFQALHGDDILFVKERVADGRLGRIRSLTCRAGWPRTRAYYARNDWAGKLRRGDAWVLDGPATNALSHQVTNMLFLASAAPGKLGLPTMVRAEFYAAGPVESHDTAAIEIQTAEGPVLHFLATHCSAERFGPVIEIDAERGRVEWSMSGGATVVYADGTRESCPSTVASNREEMIANFVEAVRLGDPSLLRCPLREARAFVVALDAAHESSRRVWRIASKHCRTVGEGDEARTVIEDVDAAIRQAAASRALFSDLVSVPWARAAEPFDARGYSRFPCQFEWE